ncbi:MAG: MFS transporter [Pseudonocardiales bacterium]|nr:MFS transporter [Pseudonocardiales bacterium]
MTPSTTTAPRVPAPRGLLAVLVASITLMLLASMMVNAIVPVIARDVGASVSQAVWMISGNLLALAVGVVLGGSATDVFGVRRSYLFGMAAFAIGAAVCTIAPNFLTFVVGRVLQGAGEGVVPAVANASVTRLLPPGQRGPALGLIFAGVGIGATSGPVVGGLVGEFGGWRAPFGGTLLVALLLILVGRRILPSLRSPERRRFDLLGGILLTVTIGLALLAVTTGQSMGFASLPVLFSCAGAVFCGLLLAWRVRTVDEPLFQPRLFVNAGFVAVAAIGFGAQLTNVTSNILIPLLAGRVGGLSSGEIGLVLTPGPLMMVVVSPLAGRLGDRFGPKPLIVTGLTVMLGAMLWLSATAAGNKPVLLAIGVLLLGVGSGAVNAPLTDTAARALDHRELGTGIGVYQACFFLGGAVGPALAGPFLDWRAAKLAPAINPLHIGTVVPAYSDAFLLVAAVALGTVLAAAMLSPPPAAPGNAAVEGEQVGDRSG